MLVQSMGTNAVHQSDISSNCKIGDLREAWNAIWEKYDSKKHMPDDTVEQFINRLNDIRTCMVHVWVLLPGHTAT